ncbi:MAG: type II toxin-antitoxin system death-on-curing family toxin [Candidatus Jettenia sp. CY-1]|nr:type II toxin-antitoxin system death-on-curing family toxin [Candidatus Jettenia sp.]WKZ17900.1 MAG: type II toxin-antitoxin system death-on-curing family toxin [Candidatus Jettenia sp. CY-1]
MNYITPEQALFIHYRIIEETGGSHGIRDLTLLQSSLSRPMATFDENDLYPDIFSKAAALMHSLIKRHPFVDGNKRTAITTASIFLLRNGYYLRVSNKELEQFTLKVTVKNIELHEIAKWFKRYSTKIST